MVDIAAISGALSSIKTAGDIANAMLKFHDVKSLQEKTIELNRAILDAQSDAITANAAQSELLERIRQLEHELAQLKSWEADKSRYVLADLGGGVVALAVKERHNGEAFHYICATCAANGKKAYLQPNVRGQYYDRYKCDGCGADLNVNKGTPPQRDRAYSEYDVFTGR
jgi:predicted SprT family Zn-dependent metalloprotease